MQSATKTQDTVSISFEDMWQEESVALFGKYDGKFLVDAAEEYCNTLSPEEKEYTASEHLLEFWAWLMKNKDKDGGRMALGNYYLGQSGMDGDNHHNGHFVINVLTGKVVKHYEG